MKFKRIRPGLYESDCGKYRIERLDEAAERYPGDAYYGLWRVKEYVIGKIGETWLNHFSRYRDAKQAIEEQSQ